MISVKTEHKVAITSPDHINPHGTAEDNSTNLDFILEIENKYSEPKFNFLDIGCSGGQLVVDFHNRGHFAVGIEGSDFSLVNERANWPSYGNKILFTADATKPYEICWDDSKVYFDLITAWEVVEHIKYDDLRQFFTNISNHLKQNGIFLASIATHEDFDWHQSVYTKEQWVYEILPNVASGLNLELFEYPLKNWVRGGEYSFHIMIKKI